MLLKSSGLSNNHEQHIPLPHLLSCATLVSIPEQVRPHKIEIEIEIDLSIDAIDATLM
jgi:hypothetical protein